MQIVLYQPEIPQNAGNIVRTCAVTGAKLTLVRPLGFSTASRHLKRAGLDYWNACSVDVVDAFEPDANCLFFSSKATRLYTDVAYTPETKLIFGSETQGLPPHLWKEWEGQFCTLPMVDGERCLNLANAVAIALYEALRQQGFRGLRLPSSADHPSL